MNLLFPFITVDDESFISASSFPSSLYKISYPFSLSKASQMKNSNGSRENGGSYVFLLLLLLIVPLAAAQSTTNNQNESYYNRFSPSMAIIIVILIAAVFLMGFFSIYIRHCADSPSASIRNLTGATSRQRRGLDQAVIDTFPTLEYSVVKIHKLGKGTLECAVCLNEFEETETLRLIPKCDHVFHPECIDEWLASHTTCPVCRANLVPEPGDSVRGIPVLNAPNDIEAQSEAQPEAHNDAVEPLPEQQQEPKLPISSEPPQVLSLNQTLNRNRTRGSRSGRPRRFPRSHSTGHSLVQPGEDTERYTLRLPEEVRKQLLLNPELHRARSLVMLPREGSSRRGYRTGEGSSRGRSSRRLDRGFKSDRWVFTMAPPFLVRASSVRSPRVANNGGAGISATAPFPPPAAADSV
ncbi:E3 ubiquitin-protein ligase ATL6-like [Vigna umbellata]|uniref:E3 ubiquitin-protein ligase ATL6-like n=1 Tax=Vigna umbellata TaxID=87088 RepID=UPI001F5E3D0C|nr:E3 ubiquitin-protein ligase ATL6-like [Vigna umbellata]